MTKRGNIFIDDPAIPQETIIYYSKTSNYTEVGIMSFLLVGGLYMLFISGNFVTGLLVVVASLFYGYRGIRNTRNKTAQIIINNMGLQTAATKFYNWTEINNDCVIKEGFDTSISFYLAYNYPKGSTRLEITDFNIDKNELERLLKIYRGRYNNRYINVDDN